MNSFFLLFKNTFKFIGENKFTVLQIAFFIFFPYLLIVLLQTLINPFRTLAFLVYWIILNILIYFIGIIVSSLGEIILINFLNNPSKEFNFFKELKASFSIIFKYIFYKITYFVSLILVYLMIFMPLLVIIWAYTFVNPSKTQILTDSIPLLSEISITAAFVLILIYLAFGGIVLVSEKEKIMNSIRKSFWLVKKNFFPIIFRLIVLYIPVFLIIFLVNYLSNYISENIFKFVFSFVIYFIIAPFSMIYLFKIYKEYKQP